MTELSNKRETKSSVETGNKKSLKFSNAEIEKFSPTFGNARNLYIPFKVPHGSHLKGLCLRVPPKTKSTHMTHSNPALFDLL